MKGLLLKFLVPLTLLGLSACSNSVDIHKQLTSFNVGCTADTVEVSNEDSWLNGTETWTAKCNGKTYSCNYLEESSTNCYESKE